MFSDYLANKLLDHTFKNTSYIPPGTVYLALFTNVIGPQDDIGSGPTEVSGGGYTRKAVSFSSASRRISVSSAAVVFDAPTADQGTVASVGLCDAKDGGHLLDFENLDCPITIKNGDPPLKFDANGIKTRIKS